MRIFHWLWPLVLVACAAPKRYEKSRMLMGTRARVVLYANDEGAANRALQAALDRIADLEQVMSTYRPTSELVRLCDASGGPPQRVSKDLFEVLDHSLRIARASDGAFDITVGPYVRLWRDVRDSGRLPKPERLAKAREKVGWTYIELDAARRTVRLARKGIEIDLGGIGKGYAAEKAARVMEAMGFPRCLVDLGGDIYCGAAPPRRTGWEVRADEDGPLLLLHDQAIASSGDTERYVVIDGRRYSHIIDPRTGLGLTHRLRVTVVAEHGWEADALASAVSVLGREMGPELIRSRPGTTVFFTGPR